MDIIDRILRKFWLILLVDREVKRENLIDKRQGNKKKISDKEHLNATAI